MIDSWGGTALNVTNYKRPGVQKYFVEKELLPAYDAHITNLPNTVLLGTGRKKREREISGWATRANYVAMQADRDSSTERTVTFNDGFSMIAKLGKLEGSEELGTSLVWYEATFVEGTSTPALAPTFVRAYTTNSNTIVIIMSTELVGTIGSASAFRVNGAATYPSVTAVVVNFTTVTLTLNKNIAMGETITVSYRKNGANDLTNGIKVLNFSNKAVTNNVINVAPVFVGATTTDAITIEITMSLALLHSYGDPFAFTVDGVSGGTHPQAVIINDTKVTIEIDTPVSVGETITVTYIKTGTSDLTNGTKVANFSSKAVTNTIVGVAPTFASAQTTSNQTIEVTMSGALTNAYADILAFAITGVTSNPSVISASVSGTKIYLTLDKVIVYGDTVNLWYTKTGTLDLTNGTKVINFADKTVTNNVIALYTVVTATTVTELTIDITMSHALTGTEGDPFAFTVDGVATSPSVTDVSISDTIITLTLNNAVAEGDEEITVTYVPSGDFDLDNTAAFSNFAVTNTIIDAYSLYAWGRNTYGQLGDGSTLSKSTPQHIGSSLWLYMSAGESHSLAIRADGTLWGWGDNSSGQIGDGSTVQRLAPVQIGSSTWTDIICGTYHSVGILNDGTLWAWGGNTYGQLGDGSTTTRLSPVQIGSCTWWNIAAGGSHSLAVRADDTLWSWGLNTYGQLGDGGTTNRLSPVQVGSGDWWSITSGDNHTVGIALDGTLWSWGDNSYGQVGDGTTTQRNSPVQIDTGYWDFALCGKNHTLAILDDDTLWSWGDNQGGQLGDGTTTITYYPSQVESAYWNSIGAGALHSAGTKLNNFLYNCGNNDYGQLGDGTLTESLWMKKVGNNNWSDVTCGGYHTLALMLPYTIGAVPEFASAETTSEITIEITFDSVLFGTDADTSAFTIHGVTGGTTVSAVTVDGLVVTLVSFTSISYGDVLSVDYTPTGTNDLTDGTSKVVAFAGKVVTNNVEEPAPEFSGYEMWACGDDINSEFGDSNSTYVLSLTWTSIKSWVSVSGGVDHSLGIDDSNYLWAWGSGGAGMGDGTTNNALIPTQIGSCTWKIISAGYLDSLAIRGDNTLWAWGYNATGQLGDGGNTNRLSPVQIGSCTWKLVNVGKDHTLGIRGDDTLWVWGANTYGQIGDNSTTQRTSPVQIGTSTWKRIAGGRRHSLGIRGDDTLWGWGYNNLGSVGDGTTTTPRKVPVQVGSCTWKAITTAYDTSLGIRGDNTLWGWGANTLGQIGDGTSTSPRLSPVQIGSSTWISINSASFHSYGIRADGTLWAWGDNTTGEVGDGTTTTPVLSPKQVGIRTDWFLINSKYYNTLGLLPIGVVTFVSARTIFSNYIELTMSGLLAGTVADAAAFTVSGVTGGTTVSVATVAREKVYLTLSSEISYGDTLTVAYTKTGTNNLYRNLYVANFSGKSITNNVYNKSLWAWGDNSSYEYGNGTTTEQHSPTAVSAYTWQSIAGGYDFTMGIQKDGSLWGWGNNLYYELGDNTTTVRTTPVHIGTCTWKSVVCGNTQSLGIKSDGTLWSWGQASYGQLGNGSTNTVRQVPAQIGTCTWKSVACGMDANSFAIRGDGTLWVWGRNRIGALGDGTTNQRTSPVQIGSCTWLQVTSGFQHSLGIRADGTLWAWGHNLGGELGDGTTLYKYSPVQIGSCTWLGVVAGNNYTLAIRGDLTLWGWGTNTYGEVGDGGTTLRNAPVQVGTSTWIALNASYNQCSLAVRGDGTLWGWGLNTKGQIGDGGVTTRLSPVQIGTSNGWLNVDSRSDASFGLR